MGINTFSKTIKAAIIVIALTFSTNTHAATSLTFGNWWSNLFNSWGWGDNTNHRCSICGRTNCDGHHENHDGDDDHSGGGNTSVPLDGGLSILLIGAATFGVKKLRGNKNDEI